jgi:N-acetylmuramoyl-L-alanine amidase
MNIKTLILLCLSLTFFNTVCIGQIKDKISKIVIDAGHGGKMPGAVGKLSKEKDINLKVALKLGALISNNFDDVSVIYTRKKDETVEVFQRAVIANKNKADLFISIHCNSVENNNQARGIETFVMGLQQTEASIAVAKKENADILLENDYRTNYSDFDPNSPEAYIIFSLYNSAYLKSSMTFASKVQKHLVLNTNLKDREVKQAKIFVLYKVAMPSILIELGFISNAEEEKFLLREDTQEIMAISIYNSFVEYKNLTEGTQKPFLPVPAPYRIESLPTELGNQKTIISETVTTESDSVKVVETVQTIVNSKEVRFRIQFFICKENLSTSDNKFASISKIGKYYEGKLWKYTSGNFISLDEAQIHLQEVKKRYADAFIIAFNNEVKITLQEARELNMEK